MSKSFLTSTLDEAEWLSSSFGRFIPGESAESCGVENNSLSLLGIVSWRSARGHTDRAIPASRSEPISDRFNVNIICIRIQFLHRNKT